MDFLKDKLNIEVNSKSDRIIKPNHGLKFLGVKLWPSGRTLNKRSLKRTTERLNYSNVSSYSGLIKQHGNYKQIKRFNWLLCEKIFTD